ncbi:MAG: DUF748 domain-containing protein, partial [bacterium]|nr:DUF748 domain-containing protein [bacterium]
MTKTDATENAAPRVPRRRRLRRWGIAAAVLFSIYSLFGFFGVPAIVRSLLESTLPKTLKVGATVDSARFNPYSLVLTVRDLDLTDRLGEPLASADALRVNLEAVSSLFSWAGVVHEIRIDGLYFALRRVENGELNFLEPAERGAEAIKEVREVPRLLVRNFVLSGATIDLVDRARDEPLTTTLGPVDFDFNTISTLEDDSGDHEVSGRFDDGSELSWTGRFRTWPPAASGSLRVDGSRVDRLFRYVEHIFQFDVRGGIVDFEVTYDAKLVDGVPSVLLENAAFWVSDLQVSQPGQEADVLSFDKAGLDGVTLRWPEGDVRVGGVRVS